MFQSLRDVSKTSMPYLGESTIIFVPKEGEIVYSARATLEDLMFLIEKAIPAVEKTEGRILIVWEGQYKSDAFEVSKDMLEAFKESVINYGRTNYKRFKF